MSGPLADMLGPLGMLAGGDLKLLSFIMCFTANPILNTERQVAWLLVPLCRP
jgi:hypothetical protein